MAVDHVLISWRKKLRISQQEAANVLGVSQATYHNWESGKTYPAFRYLPVISKHCEVSVGQLLPPDLLISIQTPEGESVGISAQVAYEHLFKQLEKIIHNLQAQITELKCVLEKMKGKNSVS